MAEVTCFWAVIGRSGDKEVRNKEQSTGLKDTFFFFLRVLLLFFLLFPAHFLSQFLLSVFSISHP